MAKLAKAKSGRLRRYYGSYNFTGCVVGAVFVYLSFLPTLLPRGWVLQGVLSAVLFTIGYAVGVTISHFYRRFQTKRASAEKMHQLKKYTFVILAILYIAALLLGLHWQQQVRVLVNEAPEESIAVVGTLFVTLLLAAFILLIARSIRSLYGWLKRLISTHIPKPIAYTVAWVITVGLVVGILNGVIISGTMSLLNEAYGLKNGSTDKGIVQPTDPQLSGSSQSLIKWDSLGRQGRNFIGRVPSTDKLSQFNQTAALHPIRIYSGLESASTSKERADLAVADLKRAGGFNRPIIVVVTTTGTGWVDEEGVLPVEYMYNGNSAIVSMQYSYLPSSLSFLVDQQKAKDAGSDLYNAVYNEALNLPKDQRPKIVVFGESLGSYGGEAAFSNEAAFRATSDGAVWAGPPNFNILRKTATANRESGSPEILPIYKQGQNVRFADAAPDLKVPDKPWAEPKAVYLENASDPIVWWSPSLLFSKPDWLKEPRGTDVSPITRWLPIVTFWGVSGDMVFSTGVPDGHGHKYGTMPTEAWSYVAPPSGWTADKTQALRSWLSGQ